MTTKSTASIYGTYASFDERLLGTGVLVHPSMVVVDPPLDRRLSSDHPPTVKRVGIVWRDEAQATVRLQTIDVVETGPSAEGSIEGDTLWGVELAENALPPVDELSASARVLMAEHRSSENPPPTVVDQIFRSLRFDGRFEPDDLDVEDDPPIVEPDPDPRPPIHVPKNLFCRVFPWARVCKP